ncbi:MAG: hypothetical protein KGJ35_00840 [Patescibacteria group bacterium]|nr:hypothetical protein [Patescibacteria group bacterium]
MLIQSGNKGIFERIIADKNGRLMRVRFAVIEVDGELRGRVISVAPVLQIAPQPKAAPRTILCLSCSAVTATKITSKVRPWNNLTSPYFSSLEFFMSQPTRAPSFK